MKGIAGCLKAVLFDFDGTLTRPGAIDFDRIRRRIGCPPGMPVLEFITSRTTASQRAQALAVLDAEEMAAAAASIPNTGAQAVIEYLRTRGLAIGIITRNGRRAVLRALENFPGLAQDDFDIIITRDDPICPKPDPAPILAAANQLGVAVAETLVVGDVGFDMQAGRAAGAHTVFLDNGNEVNPDIDCDFRIADLDQLAPIVAMALPLPAGKLPNDLLQRLLERWDVKDASVLVRPAVGEDAAAVDVAPEEVLVLKSDPITLATDAIGRYAVVVNANDVATSGAIPRWLLTTLLFPCGVTAGEIFQVVCDLKASCRQCGIALCGGHTEITDAVSRPVVTGMLAGTVTRAGLIDKKAMAAGDRVLLTKAVAVEGTAIIARELAPRLEALGMAPEAVERCRGFLDAISIIPEARIAAALKATSAMHDVTEGGLATAVEELSRAGAHRIRIHRDRIPVYTETRTIGDLLGLDPLGLIGSGSLLICVREPAAQHLVGQIRSAGIQVACIGQVLGSGVGIEALDGGRPVAWPVFEVDEITRLFGRG